MNDQVVDALGGDLDAVLLDIGATLIAEADPGTPTAQLRAVAMPGVLDAVRALAARVRVGAVTNTTVMREADVRALLAAAELDELLEVVVTSVDVGVAKPDPKPILEALQRLGVAPDRTLFVGDRPSDGEAAHAAGLDSRRPIEACPTRSRVQPVRAAAPLPMRPQRSAPSMTSRSRRPRPGTRS